VYSGSLETEIFGISWISMIIYRNGMLAASKDCMHSCTIVEHPMTVSMSLR
jgi:hypothetical protein